eukprot:15333154-Ditylum_brightwellii.AAC.1
MMSYTLFYAVGTILATQLPVVGMAPLKSLEQLGPCVVFLGYHVHYICKIVQKKHNLSWLDAWKLQFNAAIVASIVRFLLIVFVAPKGYFGPISLRVHGLFVKHTKTVNPLVNSMAKHQSASGKAYFTYLQAGAAYFFSHKMEGEEKEEKGDGVPDNGKSGAAKDKKRRKPKSHMRPLDPPCKVALSPTLDLRAIRRTNQMRVLSSTVQLLQSV